VARAWSDRLKEVCAWWRLFCHLGSVCGAGVVAGVDQSIA
jgi:hypothetical protein